MSNKQVAPPFGSPAQNQGVKSEPPVQKEADVSPLTTLFEAQGDEAGREEVVQSVAEAAKNTGEYWNNGTIGGLTLGNRSGGGSRANPFAGEVKGPKNPFGSEYGKVPEPELKQELFEVPEGTPDWRTLVDFVLKYGKDIGMVRYPNPPMNREVMKLGKGWATVIDTMWRGVPVVNGGMCEIQHVKHGWASWEDCVS